ncbi:MAG: hypothetical protein ACREFP_11305 [Acetobacteraceae bacterium]
MSKLIAGERARGADGIAEGVPSAPRTGDATVDAARAASAEMIGVLTEIARGGGLKAASPYVRARCAAAVLEAAQYLRSASVPEAAPDSDAT